MGRPLARHAMPHDTRRTRTDVATERTMTEEAWYKNGLRFACTQCGNCCSGAAGYVWVTPEEIENIARFLGREDGTLGKEHLRGVGVKHSLTEKPGGDCIFLERANGKATCGIYPVRPGQCRTWPFWEENLVSPETWAAEARTCPGMNHGRHHDYVSIGIRRRQRF